jgi:PAS domain S-box-containing protein
MGEFPIAFFAAFLLVYSFFLFIDNSIQGRSVTVYLATIAISLKMAHSIFRGKAPRFSSSADFTASVFLAYGCFEIGMIVVPLVAAIATILWTFGFVIMVNQRLNAENAEEREKMRMVFEISPYAVLITRLSDGLIVDVNKGFLAITGYSHEELVGKTILDIDAWVELGDRARYLADVERAGLVEDKEYPFRNKGRRRFDGMISGRMIPIREFLAENELILKEVHHRIKNNMNTMSSLLTLQAGALRDPASISAWRTRGTASKA